jgi:hypothetical protein
VLYIAHGVDANLVVSGLVLLPRAIGNRAQPGAIFVSINPVVSDPHRELTAVRGGKAGWIPAGFKYQKRLEVGLPEKVWKG